MSTFHRVKRLRAGWTYIQVLSYLIAAAAGVWLGAYYLGVHVEDLAYTALDESTVLEKLPEEWRPTPSETLQPDEDQVRLQAERLADELRQDLEGLKREIAELQPEQGAKPHDAPLADSPIRKSTLDYWTRLSKIAAEVARLDADSKQELNEQNVSRTLEVRARIYHYGSKSIDALDTKEVDPTASEFGHALQNWYQHAVELNEKTLAAWQGDPSEANRSGEATELTALQQQFDQESGLIRTKAADVRQQLVRRYGAEISPIEL